MRIVLLILLSSVFVFSQVNEVKTGAALGYGNIQSNSPEISTLGLNAMAAVNIKQLPWLFVEFNFSYLKDRDAFLPSNSKGKYYPSLLLAGIALQISQPLTENIFLSESGGASILIDRIFSDRDDASPAINFAAELGYHLTKRINLLAGYNIGVSFGTNSASYNMVMIKTQYRFFD